MAKQRGAPDGKTASRLKKTGSFSEKDGVFSERAGSFFKKDGVFSERAGSFFKKGGVFFKKMGDFIRKNGVFSEKTPVHPKKMGSFPKRWPVEHFIRRESPIRAGRSCSGSAIRSNPTIFPHREGARAASPLSQAGRSREQDSGIASPLHQIVAWSFLRRLATISPPHTYLRSEGRHFFRGGVTALQHFWSSRVTH